MTNEIIVVDMLFDCFFDFFVVTFFRFYNKTVSGSFDFSTYLCDDPSKVGQASRVLVQKAKTSTWEVEYLPAGRQGEGRVA